MSTVEEARRPCTVEVYFFKSPVGFLVALLSASEATHTHVHSSQFPPPAKMVLNGDSTHPNPFRNPMPFNHFAHFYYPDRIYKGWPDSVHDTAPIKPRFNVFTDTTFGWRMYLAAKKGFVLSTAAAYFDIMAVTKPKTPRAKLGRFLHITTPNTLAFMSYIAARDFLGVVSEKMGGTVSRAETVHTGFFSVNC